MAVLTAQNMFQVFKDGITTKAVIYAARNVTTGDTYDCAGQFLNLISGIYADAVTRVQVSGLSGTVITIPAGLANADGYVIMFGGAA